MISRRTWLSALAASGVLGACSPSDKEKTLRPAHQMASHAFGRHAIDVPDTFTMLGGSVVLTYGLTSEFTKVELNVESFSSGPASLVRLVASRRNEILSRSHTQLVDKPMLVEAIEVSPTAVVLRSYENTLQTDTFHTELLALVGTTLVRAFQNSYKGNYLPATRTLTRLHTQMSHVPPPDLGGKGFRIGPLLIDPDQDQENGSTSFKHLDDILIALHVDAISPNPSPALLKRWEGATWDLGTMGSKPVTLRKGPVKLADMSGEELLTQAKMDGRVVMKFSAESKRPNPGFSTPLLTLELDTEPQGASEQIKTTPWTEDDTTAVWDAVVRSVRRRPGATA